MTILWLKMRRYKIYFLAILLNSISNMKQRVVLYKTGKFFQASMASA